MLTSQYLVSGTNLVKQLQLNFEAMWLIATVAVLLLLVYIKIIRPYRYWADRGIEYAKPRLLVGNLGPFVFKKMSMADLVYDLYNRFSNKRFIGMHQFLQPTLMVNDPDLIKQILIKDFDAIPNHQSFVAKGIDYLWDKNLLSINDAVKWHHMRTTLSPWFTNNKMKSVFDIIKDQAKQMTTHFLKQGGIATVEVKDAYNKFTVDVLSALAFGVTTNTFENDDNELYIMGQRATNLNAKESIVFFGCTFSAYLMKLLKLSVTDKKVSKFFKNAVAKCLEIKRRENSNNFDIIGFLLEAQQLINKKGTNLILTDEDIIAQIFGVFVAGIDTSSNLMSFLSYELAINSDIQKRLISEIDQVLENYNGNITYAALTEMKYLDMVILEALRKWPPSEITERECIKNISIEPKVAGENPLQLDAGTLFWIPIFGIHRDPQYYPDPEKFDPERFSQQNKKNLHPYTFLPFGAGPRVCIGSRFALLKTKTIISEILSKFEFVVVEKSQIPIRLKKRSFNLITENGIWLGLRPRNLHIKP